MPSEEIMSNYQDADGALRRGRMAWHHAETALMARRDAALRRLVGSERGGIRNASNALGVSVAQVLRMLDDGITRTTSGVMARLGVDRLRYRLVHHRGGRQIGLIVEDVSEADLVQAMGEEGLRLVEARAVQKGTTNEEAWSVLKRTKKLAQQALLGAGVSSATYRMRATRGDRAITLTIVPIMAGVIDVIRWQLSQVVTDAGLVVEPGANERQFLISPAIPDDHDRELVFGWKEM